MVSRRSRLAMMVVMGPMIELNEYGAAALLTAIMRSPEFEPYDGFISLQVHNLQSVDTIGVSVVLTYAEGRFLSDLVGFNCQVIAASSDATNYIAEKLSLSIRMLIGRALVGGHIAGGEEMRELKLTLRAAKAAFDEG